MNVEMAAGAHTYSIKTASPVIKPPNLPKALRAKP